MPNGDRVIWREGETWEDTLRRHEAANNEAANNETLSQESDPYAPWSPGGSGHEMEDVVEGEGAEEGGGLVHSASV